MVVTIDQIKALRAKTGAGLGICKEALVAEKGDESKAIEYVNKRSDVIVRLFNATGAKLALCKVAFKDADKNYEKALAIIEERGWGKPVDESKVNTSCSGVIGTYVHGTDHKTVALVELTCTTDSVATNEQFRELAHDIAMQVAAMNPKYVSSESLPESEKKKLMEEWAEEFKAQGKPENVIEGIVKGKFDTFCKENCLTAQVYFKDDEKTISDILNENTVKFGEKIDVRRFLLWRLGE
ncbi:elongation factor Ts [Candidatus Dojkabacteria bacterium]|nr:elongation factor Ts [Candidatus Dojkabacteria bacterium]